MTTTALKIERRGRKRKAGKRHPSGQLVREVKRSNRGYFEALLDTPTAVYVMESAPLVKVGRSSEPGQRTGELQIGNGQSVRLYWFRWLAYDDAVELERQFHRKHKRSTAHSMGEWYYMTPETAIALIKREIATLGLFALPDELSRKAS